MEQYISTVTTFITALFSAKDWSVNIFSIAIQDHSVFCNLALDGHTCNNIPARGLQGEVKFE